MGIDAQARDRWLIVSREKAVENLGGEGEGLHRRPVPCKICSNQRPVSRYSDDRPMTSRMSSTRHTVTRGLNLIGAGYRPSLTPAHHELFEIGMIGIAGGFAFMLPTIWDNRTNPVFGRLLILVLINVCKCYEVHC